MRSVRVCILRHSTTLLRFNNRDTCHFRRDQPTDVFVAAKLRYARSSTDKNVGCRSRAVISYRPIPQLVPLSTTADLPDRTVSRRSRVAWRKRWPWRPTRWRQTRGRTVGQPAHRPATDPASTSAVSHTMNKVAHSHCQWRYHTIPRPSRQKRPALP